MWHSEESEPGVHTSLASYTLHGLREPSDVTQFVQSEARA